MGLCIKHAAILSLASNSTRTSMYNTHTNATIYVKEAWFFPRMTEKMSTLLKHQQHPPAASELN